MTPLLDQVERDFAETELGLSLILEAGAGTGKTRTMVNRLIRSVESGMKIDHLVAITFTVKAAWEMLQRLREELRKSNTSAANEALAALGGARIGTIDSLVQELLTAYPVESGVPAGFHIMSAREFNDRFDVWFTDRYHAWVDEPSLEESWAALLVLDLRPTRLQDTLRQFAQAVLRLPGDANPVAPGREPVDLVRTWREGLLAPAEALIPGTGNLEPNALAYARHLSDAAQLLLADPFIDFSPPQSLGNTGGSNGKTCRDALKLAWESLEERSAPALRYAAIRPLLAVAATDARQFADDLRNAGLLDFDRSLHHVVNMLDGQSEIRDQVSRQLAGVLIDEFQDTSPSQIRFSQLLTGIGEAPLFVVGDPKQSIYRFRGADLNGYLRFRDENTGAMPIRHLICNFRSQSEVLALVDAIFEPVFAADGRNSYYKLVPSSKQDGTVESHAVFSGALLGSAPEVSKKEAELAVQAISTALRERWKVSGEDGPRPIRCGDIAILYRAHKSSPDLEAELTAAGLPYRIESKTTALETSEIRAVRSVLRFLTRTEDDPKETREIARAAALRSLAFGLTDADLLNASRCADAEARLQCLSAQIRDLSPSRAVETIIVECGLTPLAAAARRPRATLNRLRMLLDRAMAFESSGPVELRSFVDALDAEAGERCDESPAPETDEDAVRLMTVHSAKGLEFPMVIVLGFAAQPEKSPEILRGEDGQLLVSLGSNSESTAVRPYAYEDSAQEFKKEARDELARLLYVATTRARDHVVVSLWHTNRSNELMKSIAERSATGNLACWRSDFTDVAPSVPAVDPFVYRDTEQHLARWRDVTKEQSRTTPTRLAETERERRLSQAGAAVNEIRLDVDELDPDMGALSRNPSDEPAPISPAASRSTAVGHAVHVALQMVSIANPDPAAVSANAAAEFQVDRSVVEPYVRRALETGVVQEAFSSGNLMREVYAGALADSPMVNDLVAAGTLLEGVLDVVWQRTDGSLAIIDFKTNQVSGREDALKLMESVYCVQGCAYKELLEKATDRKVSAVYFVFLKPNPAVVIDALNLPASEF